MTSGILLLTGPPCSGKSSVARLLTVPGSVLVEVDALFSLLFPTSDRNRDDRLLAYDAAHRVAGVLLDGGRTPVLECTYARREQRASLLAAVGDVPLHVAEFVVAPDEAVRRFQQRDEPTDLDEAALRERVAAFPYSDRYFAVAPDEPAVLAARVATWWHSSTPVDGAEWVTAGRGWD